jgi:hypothetical protein
MLYSDLAGADMAAPVRHRGGAKRQGVVRGGRRGNCSRRVPLQEEEPGASRVARSAGIGKWRQEGTRGAKREPGGPRGSQGR